MQTNLSTTLNSSAQGQGSGSVAKAADSQLSDMFTKLLVAQVKNQDPLSPSDPSQYVNQLAQLSQTESLQKLSSLMAGNGTLLQSMQMLAMGAQVGSDLTVKTDHVVLGNSEVKGVITLQNATSDATLVLTSAAGVKFNIALGPQPAGEVMVAIDPARFGLPAGSYSMHVDTAGGEAADIGVTGKLNSVKLSADGGALLSVENVGMVTPSTILSFNGQSAAQSN